MIASSSVRSVSRTSSVPVPSGPISIQSPVVLPSICPRRRSPWTLTLVQSTISRVPTGPVPTLTAGLLSSRIVHSGTSSIAMIYLSFPWPGVTAVDVLPLVLHMDVSITLDLAEKHRVIVVNCAGGGLSHVLHLAVSITPGLTEKASRDPGEFIHRPGDGRAPTDPERGLARRPRCGRARRAFHTRAVCASGQYALTGTARRRSPEP